MIAYALWQYTVNEIKLNKQPEEDFNIMHLSQQPQLLLKLKAIDIR